MFSRKAIAALAALFISAPALAQIQNPGVQQSGTVTVGNCAKWGPGLGQIQDAGACAVPYTPAAATGANDTNVTITLNGTPATALLQAVQFQMGWTGTLAAGRLNSNVVQSVVNDTNVTGSIAAQALTLGWTGQLSIARGGTGANTQSGAATAIFPAASSAGTIAYWNGSAWTVLAGNNSGTQVLTENASGVPSWSLAGTGTVTSAQVAAGAGIAVTGTCTITTSGVCTVANNNSMGANKIQVFSTGGASGTYTTPTGAAWLKITMAGAGGPGAGSGSATGSNPSAGGPTCVSLSGAACTTPVYQAGPGNGGNWTTGTGPSGGTCSGSGSFLLAVAGADGQASRQNGTTTIANPGPPGGNGPFGFGHGGSTEKMPR